VFNRLCTALLPAVNKAQSAVAVHLPHVAHAGWVDLTCDAVLLSGSRYVATIARLLFYPPPMRFLLILAAAAGAGALCWCSEGA
jgi:hypothetical protein